MWMHCGENMNAIIFSGGQRSSWVNVNQTLKSLLKRISRMCYVEKMDPIVFGGGQRSSGVTRGKKSKISQEFPRVLYGFSRGQRAKFSKIS
ncbi:hypothetical protein HOLleu_42308 [Holothuria leucospilota]|uniref:Uncharacterized protein n=1 Tax=Holothuria leucospilota TaxID=206669 RepID=A0A9Q0YCT4_HOLLE|nr:hypothetical protein HOLleu_42308 [Holothuria leucospilota]